MIAPRLVHVQPTHGIAVWNNVVISVVQGHVDSVGVCGMIDTYHEVYEMYPQGVSGITVLQSSLKVGTMETNGEAKRGMSELSSKLLHVSVVIENQGVLAQLLRTIVRTLNSIARSTRLSIAADVTEAARAVAPHVVARDFSSRLQIEKDVLEAIASVRAALPPPPPE
jgi:hypothetical protein